VFVIEDDELANVGQRAVAAVRRAGVSADMVATGSPRKRFEKAKKISGCWLAIIDGHVTDAGQIGNIRFKTAHGFPSLDGELEKIIWDALNLSFDVSVRGIRDSGVLDSSDYQLFPAGYFH
jgi:histidyl-tRNA synthetase